MKISKKKVLALIKEFPAMIEVDDLIDRLFVQKKIKEAEKDIEAKRLIPHEKVAREARSWYK